MSAVENPLPRALPASRTEDSRGLVLKHAANELVFAVVGHVGSGTSEIAEAIKESLSDPTLPGGPFQAQILKASSVIKDWARERGESVPDRDTAGLEYTIKLQDLGDKMRDEKTKSGDPDYSAVARQLILKVKDSRAASLNLPLGTKDPVSPDGKRRAYILDSLRHPAEVQLLRHVYQDAFVLIGVVCEATIRLNRLIDKYNTAGRRPLEGFMKRDAEAQEKYGQKVADTFHLSDFFVDNTTNRWLEHEVSNPDWDPQGKLGRLVKIVTHSELVRPEMSEIAMHHAYGAMMQSACLSRQVGAALVDRGGNVVATGTNEVPKAGGGVYGERLDHEPEPRNSPPNPLPVISALDDRCAFRRPGTEKFCSNTTEQNKIIEELVREVPELNALNPERKVSLLPELRRTRIGSLLEFSRAVHAEMDALLSAARQGISPVGTRLFVTTYPCHYCARHLVTAGVDEVQYVEPYPKSQAMDLHDDAIQITAKDWAPPSEGGKKVLFRPFSGVAPRLFGRAFLKDRDLKNKETGVLQIGEPDWGSPWHLRKASYVELEAALARLEP
jgi:deoxycytidylate deaminase